MSLLFQNGKNNDMVMWPLFSAHFVQILSKSDSNDKSYGIFINYMTKLAMWVYQGQCLQQ